MPRRTSGLSIYSLNFVTIFPNELSFKIFSCLDLNSIQNVSQVCKKWNTLLKDEILQKIIYRPYCVFGCDPDFYNSKKMTELKKIRTNYESWSYKPIALKGDKQKLKIWGMSDHETVWCSHKTKDSSVFKVNITSQKIIDMGPLPWLTPPFITQITTNARHCVFGLDRIYHIDPKSGENFESFSLAEEKSLLVRNLWLNRDILVTGTDDPKYADTVEMPIQEFYVTDMVSKVSHSFRVKPFEVIDLTFIDENRLALVTSGTKIIESGSVRFSSGDGEREILVYDYQKGELQKILSYPSSSKIRWIADETLLVYDFHYFCTGLKILDIKTCKADKFIKTRDIRHMELLNGRKVLYSYRENPLKPNFDFGFLDLVTGEFSVAPGCLVAAKSIFLNMKWGQIAHQDAQGTFWIYDFASEDKALVEIFI
ncbi:MAG: hypothetical protein K940chlam3_00883 [Chlamydiae bacterium]|nr:hypothetical protein [Chlamydiota bacterium]